MNPSINAYHTHLQTHLFPQLTDRLATQFGAVILVLAMLDLEKARSILDAGISKLGRKPRDQVVMFRVLVLMALMGETRINRWANTLKNQEVLAIAAGFAPGDSPGASTIYDFMHRLLDGPPPPRGQESQRASMRTRRRGKGRIIRYLRKEKQASKKGRIADEVKAAVAHLEQPLGSQFVTRMNLILARCAVKQSVLAGLLGPKWDIAVDGSMFKSQAKKGGIDEPEVGAPEGFKANFCADPDARFGYDSRKKGLIYGHRMHLLVVRAEHLDLPVALNMVRASEPDGALAPRDLVELHNILKAEDIPSRMHTVMADSAYDATALHHLIIDLGARAVIHLNPKNVPSEDSRNHKRDKDGRILCPEGAPMKRHGRADKNGVSTWGCPAKFRQRDGRVVFKTERCPLGQDCTPDSNQGPWARVRHTEDPRLNPVVPRGSAEEKKYFAKRSAVERIFGQMKTFGKLDSRCYRRRHQFHIVGLCHALRQHGMAWLKAAFGTQKWKTAEAVKAAFAQVTTAAAG